MLRSFAQWLKEVAGTDGGLAPDQERPDLVLANQMKHGAGAMPRGEEPLPGNTKCMKKKMKKAN
jgi:hypothetical protein